MQTIHRSPAYYGPLIGVELELESPGLYLPIEHFDEDSDELVEEEVDIPAGWLREHEESIQGVELISNGPKTFEETVVNIDSLFDDIERQGFKLQRTPRGSTHVHCNVADLTWEQMRSFVMACAWAEPFLIEIAGKGRKGNLFAQSYATTPLGWRNIINWCRHENISPALDTHYMATSFSPMGYLGSVEFRMGPSARNREEAIGWVSLVHAVACAGRNDVVTDDGGTVISLLAYLGKGMAERVFTKCMQQAERQAQEIWEDLNEPVVERARPRRKKAAPSLSDFLAQVEVIYGSHTSLYASDPYPAEPTTQSPPTHVLHECIINAADPFNLGE